MDKFVNEVLPLMYPPSVDILTNYIIMRIFDARSLVAVMIQEFTYVGEIAQALTCDFVIQHRWPLCWYAAAVCNMACTNLYYLAATPQRYSPDIDPDFYWWPKCFVSDVPWPSYLSVRAETCF
ncbi:hypothetical protein GOBAR_AA21438 [Gossypium barbadense]|uniref:Uncharacterized protein n=1 Tax=Gossypium barbadense TaxID=3634 RepID=A0A2P5X7A8_GOSBA|nr:hypothetical protein GOBAR_AA21438 [Gossypium barbadense]